MDSTLDTIDYLARSAPRVQVLQAVCTEPRTRDDLRDIVDASRVTVGRIVRDLEERGWITQSGTTYGATTRGEFVAREFGRLVENLEAFEALPPVPEWFPGEQPTFDLCLLDDATVVRADEGDLIAPIRRGIEHVQRADHLRVVANGGSREFTEAMAEAVASGATHEVLVPEEAVEALRTDPEMRTGTQAMLDTGRLTLLRYDGDEDLPVVQIGDDTVALCSGDHRAMVETDDPDVYEWAESYFASLRADATPVDPERFADAESGKAEEAVPVEVESEAFAE